MNREFNIPPRQQPVKASNFNTGRAVGLEAVGQAKLIVKAYGLSALKAALYNIDDFEKLQKERDALDEGNKNKKFSSFGLPVFDVFTFSKTDWTTLDGENISVPEFSLGVALIEINQAKNIIKTAIQGRNGTVKEYISDGDYSITIRGLVTSYAQDVYPSEEVEHLRDFFGVQESIKVGSDFLNRWGITDIVVEGFSLSQEEGNRNVQKFELQAVSDYPYELK